MSALKKIIVFLWLVWLGGFQAIAYSFQAPENGNWEVSNTGYDAITHANISYDGPKKFFSGYDVAPLRIGTDNERRSMAQRASFAPVTRLLAANREVIVVGEGMRRVSAYADEMAAQGVTVRTYSAPNMNRPVNPNAYGSPKSLDANRHWIDYWARRKGADVIDIGPQPGRTTSSPYYNMEWQNLYRWEQSGQIGPVMRIDPGY